MSRKHKRQKHQTIDNRPVNGSIESDKAQAIQWCDQWLDYHLNNAAILGSQHKRNESDYELRCAERAEQIANAIPGMSAHQFNNWLTMIDKTGYAYPEHKQ